jgi:hypothetical protein
MAVVKSSERLVQHLVEDTNGRKGSLFPAPAGGDSHGRVTCILSRIIPHWNVDWANLFPKSFTIEPTRK